MLHPSGKAGENVDYLIASILHVEDCETETLKLAASLPATDKVPPHRLRLYPSSIWITYILPSSQWRRWVPKPANLGALIFNPIDAS